jgi:hypothetical protein
MTDGDKTQSDGTPAAPTDALHPDSRTGRLPRARSGPDVADNLFFRLLIPVGFLFCAAVLMSVMASLGHPDSAVNIAIARYSPVVIAILAGLILVLGMTAMTIDRRRTLRAQHSLASKSEGAAETRSTTPES